MIRELFVDYDVDVGVYGLRFFINNKWDYVIIDDCILSLSSLCLSHTLSL
jgi:hypothetical protein